MYKITMTVNLIHLKDGYQHQYKRAYYRKTKPTVKEMDARLNKYAYSILYQLQKRVEHVYLQVDDGVRRR